MVCGEPLWILGLVSECFRFKFVTNGTNSRPAMIAMEAELELVEAGGEKE